MLQRALQLLHALRQQIPERPAEHGRTPRAQRLGRVRVHHGRPQIDIHEHDAPAGVLEQRLAQRDRPLQIDLRVHLAEGAVHTRRLPVRPSYGRRLGPYEHPPAVLRQQRELVHLPARGVHRGQQPALDLLGVRAAHGPSGQAPPAHGLVRAPPQNPLGLTVPVRHDTVGIEGAQGRVHPVQQRGKQIRTIRTVPLGLIGPQLVGGPTTPGSTHLDPLQAASARTARRFATCNHSTGT